MEKNRFFPGIYKLWKPLQEKKYRAIVKILPPLKGRILDLGSGSGYFELFLKNQGQDVSNIVSLDKDAEMLKQDTYSKTKILGDGDFLPFRSECFDLVVCIDALHLLKNNDFLRVMKPRAFILVSIFFKREDYIKKQELIKESLCGLEIIGQSIVEGKENELVVLARKGVFKNKT
jgi:ubiquinone/menaquinone biosynthesis C-methylase UbiE